jgi:uncharacterized membrane protein YraQ (UPF0718 family)
MADSVEKPGARISLQVRMGIIVLLASAVLVCIRPAGVIAKLKANMGVNLQVLLYTVLAVVISTAVHFLVPEDFAQKHLKENKSRYLLYATVLGIMTPGPVYAMYPIVFSLKSKGIQDHILVSYITGQTMIGPARISLEIGLLGFNFFIWRVALSLFMGTFAGFLFYLISGRPRPRSLPSSSPARSE